MSEVLTAIRKYANVMHETFIAVKEAMIQIMTFMHRFGRITDTLCLRL